MKEFHMDDKVIDTKNKRYGTYKGLNVENHLPLVQFDEDKAFTILDNVDNLEKFDIQ
jgi:hypothetical protein